MSVEIVQMRSADESVFLALSQAFYRQEGFVFDAPRAARLVRQVLADPSIGVVFLARRGGVVVGYSIQTLSFSFEFGGRFVLLDELFVLPEAQGAGVGRRLIANAVDFCRKNGCGHLRLEVLERNARAIEVYRAAGFRQEARHLMTLPVADAESQLEAAAPVR
jgi:ribosomal protein S18 acetylase RimI-like enzyme